MMGRPNLCSRNLRYCSSYHTWEMMARDINREFSFVGTCLEYDAFCSVFEVPDLLYRPVTDASLLASVIAGHETFVGNQGLPMAIAIGLGKDFIQEVYRPVPNCRFEGRGRYF